MSNIRFALTAFCLMGLAFIWGALFQAHYIAEQTALSSLTEKEYERADTDSLAFERAAELATSIDYPEEHPLTGDSMCAFAHNDTIFVEHWHNYCHQRKMFRYVHGEPFFSPWNALDNLGADCFDCLCIRRNK